MAAGNLTGWSPLKTEQINHGITLPSTRITIFGILDKGDYDWISGPFQPIRQIFGPDDLAPSIAEFGIAGTVLVQTWHSLAESWDYLAIADRTPFVAGVVAWVDLTDPKVDATLAALKSSAAGKWLVGIRHLLHLEADPEWLLRQDARRGFECCCRSRTSLRPCRQHHSLAGDAANGCGLSVTSLRARSYREARHQGVVCTSPGAGSCATLPRIGIMFGASSPE